MRALTNKFGGRRAYSIAEVIVSMTLIVILSATAFLACYVGVRIQSNSELNMRIWTKAESVRQSFEFALRDKGKSNEDEGKQDFLVSFHKMLAFSCGVEDFSALVAVQDLEGEEWSVSAAGTSEGTGMEIGYAGKTGNYISYAFSYRWFSSAYEVRTYINIRSGSYSIAAEGYRADSEGAAYSFSRIY